MERIGKMELFAEDSVIIKEGEINNELYKNVSGKAALYMHYGKPNEFLVGILPEQRYFGEIGFLTQTPSPFSIVAVTDVMIMRVKREEFEDFIVRNPKNTIDIMTHMAQNTVTLNKHVDLILEELEQSISQAEDKKDLIDIRQKLQQYRNSSFGMGQYMMKV